METYRIYRRVESDLSDIRKNTPVRGQRCHVYDQRNKYWVYAYWDADIEKFYRVKQPEEYKIIRAYYWTAEYLPPRKIIESPDTIRSIKKVMDSLKEESYD